MWQIYLLEHSSISFLDGVLFLLTDIMTIPRNFATKERGGIILSHTFMDIIVCLHQSGAGYIE